MDDMYANLNNPAQSAAQMQQASQRPAWINPEQWASMQANPAVSGRTEQVANPAAVFQGLGSQQAQKQWVDNHPQYKGAAMASIGSGWNGWYNDAEYNPTHNTLAQNAAAGPYVAGGNGMSGAPGGGYAGAPGLPPPSPMSGQGNFSQGVPDFATFAGRGQRMPPPDPMQGPEALSAGSGTGYGGNAYRPPAPPSGMAQGMAQPGGGGFNEQTGQRYGAAPRLMPPQAMMAQALRSRMRLR